ncbi:hypothetical protein D3Z36_02575 [Lachnospiraceae bacterium]|nr:hypothetical protein [Lachnospiraceae bacterium]
MKKRNIYKDIVSLALGCILIVWMAQGLNFWKQQQKTFTFQIQSQTEITNAVVKELEKLSGLYEFTPNASCNVSVQLEEYTMETVLTGIELTACPLKWKAAQKEIQRGAAPILFFGKEAFQGFSDVNGNPPGKRQILEWIARYQELEVRLTQESGQELRGKISGILESPSAGIYMDEGQMQEIYGTFARITGGVLKIKGKQNMEKAREILEGSGFLVEL